MDSLRCNGKQHPLMNIDCSLTVCLSEICYYFYETFFKL